MTPADRERAYSPSSCLPGADYRPFIEAYAQRSRIARAAAEAQGATWRWLQPGAAQMPRVALCTPPQGAGPRSAWPLLVFVHGGYWQELSAAESLFAAAECVQRGVAFAALDYTLAPQASVSLIVRECALSLALLVERAGELDIDPTRVVVAGSSAGAHLAAMLARQDAVRPGWRPRAAVLVSGIYDLGPLLGTSINDALGLDAAQAHALSPAHLPLHGFASDAVVCWGEVETAAFKQQSANFASKLQGAGVRCETFEVASRNHFDVILDLADATTRLGQLVFRLNG